MPTDEQIHDLIQKSETLHAECRALFNQVLAEGVTPIVTNRVLEFTGKIRECAESFRSVGYEEHARRGELLAEMVGEILSWQ